MFYLRIRKNKQRIFMIFNDNNELVIQNGDIIEVFVSFFKNKLDIFNFRFYYISRVVFDEGNKLNIE